MLSKQLTAAAIATIFGSLASNVHGHGHLVSPRSRQFVAFQDGVDSGGGSTTPLKEYCPHCYDENSGGCGMWRGRNYDRPKNALGGDLAPKIQACYAPGGVVKLDAVLTAHHMGHFSYKACAIKAGEAPSQACFDRNPLTFVEDVLYGSRPDPNYPNRAYIPNANAPFIQKEWNAQLELTTYKFSHRFRLPQGLSGDVVLIQWHYVTANSCLPDSGYRSYNFPQGFEPNKQLATCTYLNPAGGLGTTTSPEQFWNCAEVRIASNCSGGSPPSPPPPSPTISPPGPTPTGSCGNGNRGNGICADGTCCSQYGWCGTSTEHCSGGSGSPPSPSPPSPSPPSPSPPSPTPTGLGEWALCTNSNQCSNQCCSGKYSGGVLKCTPVGGFKTSEGCVGSASPSPPSPSPPSPSPPSPSPPSPTSTGLGDWALCTNSNQCINQCCSNKYSTSDGRLKCTPVGGFKTSEGCVGSATRHLRRSNEDEVLPVADETTPASVNDAAPEEELGSDIDITHAEGDELN